MKAIEKDGSIARAAKRTGVSYKYAWEQLAAIEKALGESILQRKRGGEKGGGTRLAESARKLLKDYYRFKTYIGRMLKDQEYWEAIGLKISARNRFKGIVEDIKKGTVTSSVKIKIQVPVTITALISKEAVEDLELRTGDEVQAVIKATEVMVAKD